MKFVTWPRQKVESESKDKAKEIRDEVKKKLAKVLDKILICDSQEANQDIYDMYGILLKLQDLIFTFETDFAKRKREKNIVDFSDVEHFALDILLNAEEVVKKYQNKFEEIAIDEYQDSNLVQEYILTAISRNNNIFMVGDVKQSIYKFRQAMPELFLDKYEKKKKKEARKPEEDLKIQLFKNFRSKQNILQFTNLIFADIMSKTLGDIHYDEEEFLKDLEELYQSAYAETDHMKKIVKKIVPTYNLRKSDIVRDQRIQAEWKKEFQDTSSKLPDAFLNRGIADVEIERSDIRKNQTIN